MKLFNKIIKLLYKHYQCKVISIWLSWVYFIFSQFQYCEIIIFVNFSQLPFIYIFLYDQIVICLLLLCYLSSAVMSTVFCCYFNCLLLLCFLSSAVMSTVFCYYVNCILLLCQLSSAVTSIVFFCCVNYRLLLCFTDNPKPLSQSLQALSHHMRIDCTPGPPSRENSQIKVSITIDSI